MKNIENRVRDGSYELNRVFKFTFFGVTIGFLAGAVNGVIGGEILNNYSDWLNNSSKIIQYAVDAGGALVGGASGFFAGGAIAHFLGGYGNILKDI